MWRQLNSYSLGFEHDILTFKIHSALGGFATRGMVIYIAPKKPPILPQSSPHIFLLQGMCMNNVLLLMDKFQNIKSTPEKKKFLEGLLYPTTFHIFNRY